MRDSFHDLEHLNFGIGAAGLRTRRDNGIFDVSAAGTETRRANT
jgi:hypothetical protein